VCVIQFAPVFRLRIARATESVPVTPFPFAAHIAVAEAVAEVMADTTDPATSTSMNIHGGVAITAVGRLVISRYDYDNEDRFRI